MLDYQNYVGNILGVPHYNSLGKYSSFKLTTLFGNSWMIGILKWGMAQIWSCGWELRKILLKIELSQFDHIREVLSEKPGHGADLKL